MPLECCSRLGNCPNACPKSREWFVQVNFGEAYKFEMIVKMLLTTE